MANAVLTVADLVATASLDTKLLAGRNGELRQVLWAHSCEMVDPAQWLGPHELLMTVGLCVPRKANDQADFIARLDDAGLAGMIIGDHETAPPISSKLLAEADRRGFPVLLAGSRIPYAVIARHVAAANSTNQTLQVLKLSKLYHLAAYAGDDTAGLVRALGSFLAVDIEIIDSTTNLHVLSSSDGDRSAGPNLTDLSQHTYRLKGHHAADMVLSEYDGVELDSFILVHLIKVMEVAVDRILEGADHRARNSAGMMLSLLNGTVPPDIGAFIAPHLLSEGFRLVAFPRTEKAVVARATASAQLPVVVGAGRINHLALVPVGAMTEFRDRVQGVAAQAGISSVFTDYADTRTAAIEAGKVLADGQLSGSAWTEFEGSSVSVLTRSHREARDIIEGVLGPLAEGNSRAEMLRETLFTYLHNDRRWRETAEELGIHRQTLSYRLGKIEELTGLTLSKTADLSATWIAYQAWRTTHPS